MQAGVTTVTYTVPVPGGLVAVILVLESTFVVRAREVPNSTSFTAVKARPVITTMSWPAAAPLLGEILVMMGSRHLCGPEGTTGTSEVVVGAAEAVLNLTGAEATGGASAPLVEHAVPVVTNTTADTMVTAASTDRRAGDAPAGPTLGSIRSISFPPPDPNGTASWL
jgi:hypothetical protein